MFFDIVEVYGFYFSEEFVGEVLVFVCDCVVIVIKFGFGVEEGKFIFFNSYFDYICCVVEGLLKCLKMDYIDFFYQYCFDLNVLIEDVVEIVKVLIQEGKVKYWGLLEVSVRIICCVYVVFFVIVVQSEYVMWWWELEMWIFLMFEELGIGFVFYCLIVCSFFVGVVNLSQWFDSIDWWYNLLCFQFDVLVKNMVLFEFVQLWVCCKNIILVQFVLVWVMVQWFWIVFILGMM